MHICSDSPKSVDCVHCHDNDALSKVFEPLPLHPEVCNPVPQSKGRRLDPGNLTEKQSNKSCGTTICWQVPVPRQHTVSQKDLERHYNVAAAHRLNELIQSRIAPKLSLRQLRKLAISITEARIHSTYRLRFHAGLRLLLGERLTRFTLWTGATPAKSEASEHANSPRASICFGS